MDKGLNLYMSILRDKNTGRQQFRHATQQLTNLLVHQVLQYVETRDIAINTPLATADGISIVQPIMLIPILRSGMAMIPSLLYYFPNSFIGVVGFKRDEQTAQAALYYENIPSVKGKPQILIVDPMIATGGTGIATLGLLEKKGVDITNAIYISIIGSPEGLDAIKKQYPAVTLLVAVRDKGLNQDSYIIPGLGDFGDRFFGTD